MVQLKMLMKIGPPTMRGLLVMTMASISPSRREVSPAESLHRRGKLLLPKFHLEMAVLHPESPLFIFFVGKMTLYTRIWAPEASQGAHYPPGRARGGRRALVPSGHLGGLSVVSFLQYFLYNPK
jgi:hypothetical protein